MINVHKIRSEPSANALNLEVLYDHLTHNFTVKAGKFKISAVDYELVEDEITQIPVVNHTTSFIISLVLVNDEVRVFSDKVDDFDPLFDFSTSNMKKLLDLAIISYQDGTFNDPAIVAYQILPYEVVESE